MTLRGPHKCVCVREVLNEPKRLLGNHNNNTTKNFRTLNKPSWTTDKGTVTTVSRQGTDTKSMPSVCWLGRCCADRRDSVCHAILWRNFQMGKPLERFQSEERVQPERTSSKMESILRLILLSDGTVEQFESAYRSGRTKKQIRKAPPLCSGSPVLRPI